MLGSGERNQREESLTDVNYLWYIHTGRKMETGKKRRVRRAEEEKKSHVIWFKNESMLTYL